MKILFISRDLIAGNVAHLLVKEGHEVKLYIENKKSRHNFDNMVPRVSNWRAELSWVGKDGLIIFDDIGYGKVQDRLRKQGYTVFGGSEGGDLLELDREHGQHIFSKHGMQTMELKDFDNMDDAAMHIKKHPAAWVIKTNNHDRKFYNYVGELENGEDTMSLLRNYLLNSSINKSQITLQKRIHGVEVGIGRYFNGSDWVGPIEYNIEHPRFLSGDIGPTTSEMGTLAWLDDDEENPLFLATLAKLKEHLRKIDFRGDFEINCIANEEGIYPLEATARLGTPIVHLHSEFFGGSWGKFLYAIASGKSYEQKWKKGYGIVLLVAVPPFPYSRKRFNGNSYYGMNIYFKDFTEKDFEHIHFEEVSVRSFDEKQYYITDNQGYILYVTGIDKTFEEAQAKVYDLAQRIVIPKAMYRNDIGTDFIKKGLPRLHKWGYIK
jgi:phosphoribosylamine--glycine ligase